MNAATRDTLDREPVPVDHTGLAALACAVYEGGKWCTAWLIGTGKHPFGQPYPSARAAADAARYLNERRP